MRVFTYRDDDGRDESPADFEEERRREAQHHLHVFEVFFVACGHEKRVIQMEPFHILIMSYKTRVHMIQRVVSLVPSP